MTFLAFATSEITFIKLFGLGLALAVVMDATVVRATLVPAFMKLAGEANWWAPRPLRRLHDRFGISESGPAGQDEPVEERRVLETVGGRLTARSRPPTATEGERLREDILDAAEQLLVELGDEEAVSIRAIARRVGVTAPAIYLHFADKAELLFAVCERRPAGVTAPAGGGLRPLRRREPRALPDPVHGTVRGPARGVALRAPPGLVAFGHLVAAVQQCIDAGVFRPVDPLLAAKGLWVAVHGLASLFVARPDFPWGDRDALVDHVLATHAFGLAKS